LRPTLAITRQNHLNTTLKIVLDWNWPAFEKKWTYENGPLNTNLFDIHSVAFISYKNYGLFQSLSTLNYYDCGVLMTQSHISH
jgi:hypothetical protein